jgi:hypothetical protein
MPQPKFTPEEQFIVSYIKSDKHGNNWAALIGFFVPCIAMGLAGLLFEVPGLLAISLLLVCGFRFHEEWRQSRFLAVWRSIISKYEAALEETVDRHPPLTNWEQLSNPGVRFSRTAG